LIYKYKQCKYKYQFVFPQSAKVFNFILMYRSEEFLRWFQFFWLWWIPSIIQNNWIQILKSYSFPGVFISTKNINFLPIEWKIFSTLHAMTDWRYFQARSKGHRKCFLNSSFYIFVTWMIASSDLHSINFHISLECRRCELLIITFK